MEVPKRWFLHFYMFSTLITTVALVEMYRMYVNGNSLSPWFNFLLDVLTTPSRTASVSFTSAVIALVILTLQAYRRLYECLYVSVFSTARMNITHYLVGLGHYLGALALLLAELPGFNGRGQPTVFLNVEAHHVGGVVMCVLSFIVQHHTLTILANLRKKQGKNGKERYVLPRGGLFCVVSCPHMLAEFGIYIGVMLVLWSHYSWPIVTLWVLCNQVVVARMNHKWYQNTFKDYPKKRKAMFPYIL
ncbi:hypothetical protein Pmani_025712 [Petrolisthes manimaculis]|uniref:Polyprenal reductase n=1 Tax=Petrolisthes manimaculis TaxID=1843537 RepID=A0AAE1P6R0_9EUCA|nr:hypothetical protein Pmani_025712 [Petrolisthes manimaculis]